MGSPEFTRYVRKRECWWAALRVRLFSSEGHAFGSLPQVRDRPVVNGPNKPTVTATNNHAAAI